MGILTVVTRPKGTSCFCEHTAEFVIVSRIRALLEPKYGNVVPVYFWKSREGNIFSNLIHEGMKLRILAVFPRRPKLKTPYSETIITKINTELYEYSQAARLVGIPTIAGVPLVNSISKLLESSTIIWTHLIEEILEDVHFEIKLKTKEIISVWPNKHKLETIDEEDIPVIVEKHSKHLVWRDAVENIYSLASQRYKNEYYRRPFFFGGYKPVHFFIFDQ